MASVLKMPRLSDTMKEGVVVRWLKQEGEAVSPGVAIAEVETDKATMEMESFEDGFIAKHLVAAGSTVAIGEGVAIITAEKGEDFSALLTGAPAAPAPSAPVAAAPAPAAPPAPAVASAAPAAAAPATPGRLKASPLARKIAGELAVDLGAVAGSGPGGRIVARDVTSARAAAPAVVVEAPAPQPPAAIPSGSHVVPFSQMRKAIARRMVQAKQAVPHFYLTMDIDMDAAAAFREELNKAAAGSVKISFNDLVLKASALALAAFPAVNVSFADEQLVQHTDVHMGFAVAIEGGLITPVIRSAHTKSVGQIAREARELAALAQEKKLKPDQFEGGTFTVSNLGMFGIREFSAIINPPQAAILAVGAVLDQPVVKAGQLAVGKRMTVTLSCDHRVVDGATGAQFLGVLRDHLQNPMRLVL